MGGVDAFLLSLCKQDMNRQITAGLPKNSFIGGQQEAKGFVFKSQAPFLRNPGGNRKSASESGKEEEALYTIHF
jgi:hypothetical protein